MKSTISYQSRSSQPFNIKVEEGNRVKVKSDFESLPHTERIISIDANLKVDPELRREIEFLANTDKVIDTEPRLMPLPEAKESTGFISKLRNLFK